MLFTIVGVVGYGVQTAALWLLIGKAGAPIVVATLLATELAVLHNVAWHVRVTWADRPVGPMATLGRLLRFNVANGGVSLAGGAILMPLLVDEGGMHYLVANFLTVLVCSVVNYVAGDRWVFALQQPVVKVGRCIVLRQAQGVPSAPRDETDEAPGSQGARCENSGHDLSGEQSASAPTSLSGLRRGLAVALRAEAGKAQA